MRPTSRPMALVRLGALNFTQASRQEMPRIIPAQSNKMIGISNCWNMIFFSSWLMYYLQSAAVAFSFIFSAVTFSSKVTVAERVGFFASGLCFMGGLSEYIALVASTDKKNNCSGVSATGFDAASPNAVSSLGVTNRFLGENILFL